MHDIWMTVTVYLLSQCKDKICMEQGYSQPDMGNLTIPILLCTAKHVWQDNLDIPYYYMKTI